MESTELAGIVEGLAAEKTRLLDRIAELKAAIQPIKPDCALGHQGRLEVLQYQEVQKTELAAVQTRLEHVNAALVLVSRGRYGHCEICGEKIPRERLKACPEASRCIACADPG